MKIRVVILSIISLLMSMIMGCSSLPTGYKPTIENENIGKKHDEFNGISYYRYGLLKNSPVEIYLKELDIISIKFPAISFTYTGTEWIFFESVTFLNSKNEKLTFYIKSYERTDDILSGGLVQEYAEKLLQESEKKQLLKLLNENEGTLKVRFSGKYYKDYNLSEDVVNALKIMLEKSTD